jgi:beta-glucosidase
MEIAMPLPFLRSVIKLLARGSVSCVLLGSLCAAQLSVQAPATLTSDSEATRFVDDLLAKMTLEEKVGQMSQIALNTPDKALRDERILKGEVGSFLFITDPKEINRLQHLAVEKSRLHIPLIFGYDVIHGFRTIYPVPIALAASWDPAQAEKVQSMAAREASSVGVNWTFAPMVDIARDPRRGSLSRFAYGRSAGAGISGRRDWSPGPYLGLRETLCRLWRGRGWA